jgi:Na+-driven multidrug efflux pump
MRQSFKLALAVNVGFTAAAWIVVALLSPSLVAVFGATGDAANLITLFNVWLAPLFAFTGALFVVNAVFNTLGFAHYATFLNWMRATVGTVPLVHLGGRLAGAEGVLVAHMAGGIVFGCFGVWLCLRVFDRLLPDVSAERIHAV